ncbi:F-box/kelch-repeat protein At4g19870-like isoform X2 [Rhododendron vialii]|uniref:F-box/kelch-repeat protein At4g19870-like isoform X2 n=1 Tax=Rhododendron vialii TaxID=182163 RepID=UPI00265F1B75|nr:F-box/kelch-repeat protein At4g19870-like isoform X2 [Rhododendron vialii]
MASSSQSSLPPTEKSVYVRAINSDFDNEWYSFPLNGPPYIRDGKRKRGLGRRKRKRGIGGRSLPLLTPLNPKMNSLFASFAVVDSTIYSIGGNSPGMDTAWEVYREVCSWDTSRVEEESWETSPSMGGARSIPQVVTLNGMIYVMGGISGEDDGPHPWAEVFDPKSGSWSSLNQPCPKPSFGGSFSAALPSTNQVLVGSAVDGFICLYNVGSKTWEHLHHEIDCLPSSDERPVVAGTTLFWFQYGMLHAYDLLGKWNYSAPVRGLEDVVPLEVFKPDSGCSSSQLLCLADNDVCLVCCEYSNTKKHLGLLHCIRISVSPIILRGRKAHFDAVVATSQAYFFKMPRAIRDAVLMFC